MHEDSPDTPGAATGDPKPLEGFDKDPEPYELKPKEWITEETQDD